jgi:hypothetical protein
MEGLHKKKENNELKNNELDKLRKDCRKWPELEFAGLISWAPEKRKEDVRADIEQRWDVRQPLLLVISHYDYLSAAGRKVVHERKLEARAGEFRGLRQKEMRFYRVAEKKAELLFKQPVLPWELHGSRWECLANPGVPQPLQ